MRLVLIRHGESEHARLGLVAGLRGCPGLTERGRGQAQALRRRLAQHGPPADVLLSSPVPRARQTAEIIAPALRPEAGVDLDAALCEPDPGEGDGLTTTEFAARYGSCDARTRPDRPLAPGGESWNDFLGRVRGWLDRLPSAHPGRTVVAVTHAGVIVTSFLMLLGVPRPGTGARIDPDPASLTTWDFHEADRVWRLVSFNDTAHLARPAASTRAAR